MMAPKQRKAPILERHFFPANSVIMTEGEAGSVAYLVLSGKVGIYTDKGDKRVDIAALEAGEVFGEMALFSKSVRNASARAIGDCNLMVLTRPILMEKMRGTDPTIQAIFNMLMERVSAANTAITAQGDTIGTLANSINEMFAQAMETLPEDKRASFKKEVQPILREFIRTVEGFSD